MPTVFAVAGLQGGGNEHRCKMCCIFCGFCFFLVFFGFVLFFHVSRRHGDFFAFLLFQLSARGICVIMFSFFLLFLIAWFGIEENLKRSGSAALCIFASFFAFFCIFRGSCRFQFFLLSHGSCIWMRRRRRWSLKIFFYSELFMGGVDTRVQRWRIINMERLQKLQDYRAARL